MRLEVKTQSAAMIEVLGLALMEQPEFGIARQFSDNSWDVVHVNPRELTLRVVNQCELAWRRLLRIAQISELR
jgi:hypothetical protein